MRDSQAYVKQGVVYKYAKSTNSWKKLYGEI